MAKTEVTFLGHKISQEGSQPDPKNVEAVLEMKPPTKVKEVRRFLDHQPLTSIFKRKTKSARMNRWILEMREYQYNIQYVKGKYNYVADQLSRPFTIIDELLYYAKENIDGSIHYSLVVPQVLIPKALEHAHELSGHLGQKKTIKKAEELFYWCNLKFDVTQRGVLREYSDAQLIEKVLPDLGDILCVKTCEECTWESHRRE
ncbi:uncharacterized protein LOC135103181 [Scylla paramamosain]|uniref:uncharacterized protein LOC135103181 n=1 Tax=Scylla paramamosain TaxID=85552 RepID=UPI003082D4E0